MKVYEFVKVDLYPDQKYGDKEEWLQPGAVSRLEIISNVKSSPLFLTALQ